MGLPLPPYYDLRYRVQGSVDIISDAYFFDTGCAVRKSRQPKLRSQDEYSTHKSARTSLKTFIPGTLTTTSSNTFLVPSKSSISTFSTSIFKLTCAKLPPALRQFAQWHMWPLRRVKSELSVMVTRMLPQRQVPVKHKVLLQEKQSNWYAFAIYE
jgi:hypothetical protein